MQKLLNKKLLIPASLSILVIFIVILYKLDFRITYAPELENSWEAVSAVAAWFGVISSFVAIWCAIQVPNKIAEEQNKISLFEKRFACYTIILNFLACAKQIEDATTKKDIQTVFRIYFGSPQDITKDIAASSFIILLKQKEVIVVTGEFLFKNYNTSLAQEILETAIDLITLTGVFASNIQEAQEKLSEEVIHYKNKYCQKCEEFSNLYKSSMENDLNLKMTR